MSGRYFRENSQIIASLLVSGYIGTNLMYRINLGDFWRSNYEFKNRNNIPLVLSIKEEEETKKFLYRLKHTDGTFRFFRSNSLDFIGFGYNKLRQGSDIALPSSYFVNTQKELLELSPPKGFDNFLGRSVRFSDLNTKLSKEKLDEFYNTILLSNDAKLFGLAHAISQTNHFITSSFDIFFDFVCISLAYSYAYMKSRQLRLQVIQRRRLYLFTSVLGLVIAVGSRFALKPYNEKKCDTEACRMGLDCCQGSVEFYDKMIKRNKILRDLIENGHSLIDSDGNYLKQLIRIPFTDSYFYINNFGLKLTDRLNNCKHELNKMVFELIKENDDAQRSKENLKDVNVHDDDDNDGKEWLIFKDLRLRLEKLTNKSNNSNSTSK